MPLLSQKTGYNIMHIFIYRLFCLFPDGINKIGNTKCIFDHFIDFKISLRKDGYHISRFLKKIFSCRHNLDKKVLLFAVTSTIGWLPSSHAHSQETFNESFERTIRVQLAPVRHTILSAEISGIISHLSKREGEHFETGETLAELDCTMHSARLSRAEAQIREALTIHQTNKRLQELGSVSILELEISETRKDVAYAELEIQRSIVDRCTIAAPFPGRIVEYFAQEHQYVSEGQAIVDILDDSLLEVHMIIPSQWLNWLKPGIDFLVSIDESSKNYTAKVARIGARVDPVSQSIRVYGIITTDEGELISGMSGNAKLIH